MINWNFFSLYDEVGKAAEDARVRASEQPSLLHHKYQVSIWCKHQRTLCISVMGALDHKQATDILYILRHVLVFLEPGTMIFINKTYVHFYTHVDFPQATSQDGMWMRLQEDERKKHLPTYYSTAWIESL